jgi:hypothetical protein
MSRVWLGGFDAASSRIEWFEQPEPDTEAFPVVQPAAPTRLVSAAEHQAALAEIDLPPHPLRLRPSRWAGARRWSAETLQVALGATLGCGGVLAILSVLAWFAR